MAKELDPRSRDRVAEKARWSEADDCEGAGLLAAGRARLIPANPLSETELASARQVLEPARSVSW